MRRILFTLSEVNGGEGRLVHVTTFYNGIFSTSREEVLKYDSAYRRDSKSLNL